MSAPHRPHAPVALLLILLVASLAGCVDDDGDADGTNGEDARGDPGADTSTKAHEVTLLLTGFDAPHAGEEYAAQLTIGHLALHEFERDEWVPILTESMAATVFFDVSESTVVGTFPLLSGRYDEAELLIDNASVLGPTATEAATVDQPVCYTAITLDLTSTAPPTQLELLLSGEAGVRGDTGSWTVRPALVGSLTDDPDDEPIIQDVECADV